MFLDHCGSGGVLTAAAVRTPLDTADGPADNKTQGCRSDHYFSQDLNQGGENDPPRSKVSKRLYTDKNILDESY